MIHSPALALTFLTLIALLGDGDYRAREQAQADLKALLPLSAPAVRWAMSHPDPEVSLRAGKLWRHHCWTRSGELRPTHWKRLPWVDSIPYGESVESREWRLGTIHNYLGMVGATVGDSNGGGGAPHWPGYVQATRFYVFDLLLAGESEADVIATLDAMVVQEKVWILKHRDAFGFSAEVLDACKK